MSYGNRRQSSGYGNYPKRRTSNKFGAKRRKHSPSTDYTIVHTQRTKGLLNIPTGERTDIVKVSEVPTSVSMGENSNFGVDGSCQGTGVGISQSKGSKTDISN